jgi:hypothetical protein
VNLRIDPPASSVTPGEIFSVDVVLQAGDQPVDSVDAYVSFDPANLRVVDTAGNEAKTIVPGNALPLVLQNGVDNGQGRIVFSAGRQLGGIPPTGDLLLATIRFKAVAATSTDGIPVAFETGTDVFSRGDSVLGTSVGGVVIIGSDRGHRSHLPLLVR